MNLTLILELEQNKDIQIYLIKDPIGLEYDKLGLKNSVLITLKNESKNLDIDSFILNEATKNKPKVKNLDLKSTFDPLLIAEKAVDLNLNLTKWRMSPDLDIDVIKKTKFLLIGAGTLGCHVSRNLLGWGARHITFVDNGKISYSNPMRQNLYNFEDSKNSLPKAKTAAIKIKEICPFVDSEGFEFNIPHPGRTLIDDNAKNSFFKTTEQLENLIRDHDIVFLLTDSRESRWLPTLLSRVYNKTCITAAMGFDSYLVLRHGIDSNNKSKKVV
jgi:ubiquitin-like modifier-activating enzyme ATG7